MTASKSAPLRGRIEAVDPIWAAVRAEGDDIIASERALALSGRFNVRTAMWFSIWLRTWSFITISPVRAVCFFEFCQ